MRESLPELREQLPGVRLVLAAMGPKMCALGGAEFDGVFFNWMTPEFAAGAREKVEAGAREAGRETPPIFGYVRTAVGPDAAERLAKEESFYRDLHKGYRDHFDRLGEPEGTVGVAAADRDEAQAALAAYEGPLDTVVVRGLASAKVEAMTAVAAAAAPVGRLVRSWVAISPAAETTTAPISPPPTWMIRRCIASKRAFTESNHESKRAFMESNPAFISVRTAANRF